MNGYASAYTGTKFWARLVNDPGGFFVVVTGIASLTGVYLTLSQVLEIRNSIASFTDFVNRVAVLIDDTREDDVVQMMLHTPATGCLALPPVIWRQLVSKICDGTKRRFSLTCLSQEEMAIWFERYKEGLQEKQKTEMAQRICDGLYESGIIKAQISQYSKREGVEESWEVGVLEGTWADLPGSYYVANSHRAIVVVPFYLPTPFGNIPAEGVHYRNVDMIGFETSDFHVVDTVRTEIQTRRRALYESSRDAQASLA